MSPQQCSRMGYNASGNANRREMEKLPAIIAGMATDQVLYIELLTLVVELEFITKREAVKRYTQRYDRSFKWIEVE